MRIRIRQKDKKTKRQKDKKTKRQRGGGTFLAHKLEPKRGSALFSLFII
jgi:hypothetical protein